jgi:hypothetical protein
VEDRIAYKSRGKVEAERMKGFVVGATSATPSTYAIPSAKTNDPTQGMTKAQKKNYQRKLKKLEEKSARNWDSEDEESEEEAGGSGKVPKPVKTYAVKEVKTDEEPDDRFDIHKDSDDERLDKAIHDIEVPELGVKPEFGVGFNKYRDPIKGPARPPRPGGIFRDLGLKPKSTSGEAEDKVVLAEPVKPTKPTPPPTTKPAKRTVPGADQKASAKDAPRQRPEVRVRPGHGLAGMMKQLAVQDTTSVRR